MLENGANPTDSIGGKSVLELAVKTRCHTSINELLIQQIAKMEYVKVVVPGSDYLIIESKDRYKRCYEESFKELGNMEETEFYKGVSVLCILIGSRKEVSRYIRNKELVEAFKARSYENKFPIHFASLRNRFNAEVNEQRNRNKAAKVLSNIFKFNDPFHLVNQKILSFMKHSDLLISLMPS